MDASRIKYSPRFLSWFGLWLRAAFRVRFENVCLAGADTMPRDRTVVVVANHMSWWDGFLIYMLRRRLGIDSPIYPVMLEDQLKAHAWLRRIGCVGIKPGNSSSTRRLFASLAEACENRPGSWIVFFPQGEIVPTWKRPLGFRRGIELLLRHLPDSVVLPVALHIEPLTTSRPTAFLLAGDSWDADEMGVRDIEFLVTSQLDRLQDHILRTGERAASLWSEATGPVRTRNANQTVPSSTPVPEGMSEPGAEPLISTSRPNARDRAGTAAEGLAQ